MPASSHERDTVIETREMLGTRNVLIAGLALWIVSGVVPWYGGKSFRRESLIARV